MKSAISILLLLIPFTSFAQLSIQGIVIDSETNTPLPGANVYIANTTKGTSTGKEGKFRIDVQLSVQYEVVVSFIGYERQAFEARPKDQVIYRVVLRPASQTLREIVVRGRRMSRIKRATYLRNFTEHFIGKSDNSLGCKFENPDVLTLDKEGDVIVASTDSTLLLLNKGLGYRVKIDLETYRYNTSKDNIHYEGHMVYELLTPSSEHQKRRWARNRLQAYYGSQMHFYRSLYNRRANEEGYYFYFVEPFESDTIVKARSRLFNNMRIKVPSMTGYDKIIDTVQSTREVPVLKFSGPLQVNYLNEGESVRFQRAMKVRIRKAQQVSQIRLRKPATILPDGRISPISAAQVSGYWSWELMSESLPLDYDPGDDIEILGKK